MIALAGHATATVPVDVRSDEALIVAVTLAADAPDAGPAPTRPAGRGGFGGGGYRPPSRDCSGEERNCRDGCDDAASDCRMSCPCGSCATGPSRTWDDCNRECETCRRGCEQNERFCDTQCDAQARSCR